MPGTATQPAGWANTGILPASADEPPPEDPGMVKVSVPEARRLLHLGHRAHQPCRPPTRLRLAQMAAPAPGPRPLPPLPDPAPGLPSVSHDQVTKRDCSTGQAPPAPAALRVRALDGLVWAVG